jgi:hypothetical protein
MLKVNSLKSQIKTVLTDDEDSKIGCYAVVEGYYENNPYSQPQLNSSVTLPKTCLLAWSNPFSRFTRGDLLIF